MTRLSIIIITLCAVIWFALLGHRDLFDPDEGRYASIPAAMVNNDDWLTPRLNDFKYFEKPALQYWGTAVAFELFGQNNTSARLLTALSGFLTALFSMLVAHRLYDRRAGIYAFLMCVSYYMVVVFGHYLTLDMLLTALMFAGIGSLLIAQSRREDASHVRRWMLGGWAALALATLTKGPVAIVLPGATVAIYMLWQRDWKILSQLHIGKGLLLYLLITAPWFIAVSRVNSEFASFFFIHENFQRYTTEIHRREGPIYYYLPFLFAGVCPWIWTSLRTLFKPGFKWRPEAPGTFHPERFMWVFVVTTIVFFSLAHSKLPGYILPILPVLAVMSGKRLTLRGFARADFWTMLLAGLIAVLVATNISQAVTDGYPLAMLDRLAPWILAAGVLYLVAAAILMRKRNSLMFQISAAAILSLASANLVMVGSDALGEKRSSRVITDAISRNVPANTPIFSFQSYPEGAQFYLGRPITIVDYRGELAMGIKAEPEKFIATQAEFLERWHSLEQAALVVTLKRYNNLDLEALQGKIVFKGLRSIVIVKK